MRVPGYQLITDAIDHLIQGKLPLLPPDPGIKNDMQQHIPQLLFDPLPIPARNSIRQLIGLFDRKGTKRLHRLLFVPGTLLP